MATAWKSAQEVLWSISLLSALALLNKVEALCPVFGTNQNTSLETTRPGGLYLNFAAPSQCRGNVTTWKFCYYRPPTSTSLFSFNQYSATFVVFRRASPMSNLYAPIPESLTVKTINYNDIHSAFECAEEVLSQDKRFEIRENDIVGTCISNSFFGRRKLDLLSTNGEENSSIYTPTAIPFCTSLDQITVNMTTLSQRNSYVVHLSAEIASASDCKAGSKIPPTVPLTNNLGGTYLDFRNRVTCGNHITKWHYCYYTEAATPGSTLSMTVAVWSLDAGTNTFIVSPSSIRNITIQHVQTFAKIFCMEESLNENEIVAVSHGSILGVVLPSENAIPIIKSNAEFTVAIRKLPNDDRPQNFRWLQTSRRRRTGMHLHITVGNTDLPTAHPATVVAMPTATNPTGSKNRAHTTDSASEEALQNSTPNTVVLLPTIFSAFTIAVVVIAAVTVACIIIYVKKKSHHYETVKPLNTNARNNLRSSHQNEPNFNMVKNMAYHSRFNKGMKRIFVPSADGNVEIHGAHNICGENDYACGQNDYACINDNNDSPYTLMNETQT